MMVNKTYSAGELVKVAQKLLAKELRDLTHRGATKSEKSSTTDLAKTLVAAILSEKPSKSSGSGKSRAA